MNLKKEASEKERVAIQLSKYHLIFMEIVMSTKRLIVSLLHLRELRLPNSKTCFKTLIQTIVIEAIVLEKTYIEIPILNNHNRFINLSIKLRFYYN